MDWQARYLAGDTPWAKGTHHPALPQLLADEPPPGAVIIPGCGHGHDVLAIARKYSTRLVLGVDLAEIAVTEARQICRDQPNVRILHADFLGEEPLLADGAFAMLWEHTCFCAIHPSKRTSYVATAARLLRPGGLLTGVFFLNLDREGDGPPWNCPESELRELFGADFEVSVIGPSPGTFPGRETEEFAVSMVRR